MRVSTPFKDNLVKKYENKGVPTGRYAKSVDSSENIKILMQTDTTPDLRDMTSSDPNRSANFELTDQFKTANQATSLGVSIKAGGEVIHRQKKPLIIKTQTGSMGLAVSNRDLTMGKSGNDSKSVLEVDDHQMQSK